MDPRTFRQFQTLIYDKSGISLKEGKEALVATRIAKRIRELSLPDDRAYLKHLETDANGEEIIHLLDAISTNVTQFFREPDHFTVFEAALKEWSEEGQKRFRFWSAACSTGQEPYSLALSASTALDLSRSDVRILATDLCTRVLKVGKAGRYALEHLKEIPRRFQTEPYLHLTGDEFEFSDEFKRLVTFGRLNLSAPPFPMHGPFDVVFCRNVMIYFDQAVRARVITQIFRLLKVGGYLMVGHSETITGLKLPLRPVKPSVYLKESDSEV